MTGKPILAAAALIGPRAGAIQARIPPELAMPAGERARIEASVFYSGCNEVRALGKAPIHAGDPGYRAEMDGDGDGIACEPYRSKRPSRSQPRRTAPLR